MTQFMHVAIGIDDLLIDFSNRLANSQKGLFFNLPDH